MTLYRDPFTCCSWNRVLLEFAWILFFPFYHSVNRLVRLSILTTREQQRVSKCRRATMMVFCFPFWVLVLLLSGLPALLAFFLWFPLQFCRRNYRYSSSSSILTSSTTSLWSLPRVSFPLSLTIAQANVCLLPEFATRANNLNAPTWRVREIAKRLMNLKNGEEVEEEEDEVDFKGSNGRLGSSRMNSLHPEETVSLVNKRSPTHSYSSNEDVHSTTIRNNNNNNNEDVHSTTITNNNHDIADNNLINADDLTTTVDSSVRATTVNNNHHPSRKKDTPIKNYQETAIKMTSEEEEEESEFGGGESNPHVVEAFPDKIDFLCLCEVFDRDAAKTIVNMLHKRFDHIVYDISERPALNLLKACNSGLLFASKHPILDVDFRKYVASEGSDSLALKGVLLVKMLIGLDAEGKRLTGFLTHTHLQAKLSTRSCNVQKEQLDWVEAKMIEFQSSRRPTTTTTTTAEELVCFDLLTGDLNFDSTSADEAELATHSLFRKFRDPCRDDEGNEKEWTVGTELSQPKLYDPRVLTPEGLKKILTSKKEIRREFVASTNCLVGGEGDKNGKRRIDYICLDETVDVKIDDDVNFRFVTALATLTDHVPMAMTFTIRQ